MFRPQRPQGRDSIHHQTVSLTFPQRSQCCGRRCLLISQQPAQVRSKLRDAPPRRKQGAELDTSTYEGTASPPEEKELNQLAREMRRPTLAARDWNSWRTSWLSTMCCKPTAAW